MSETCNENCASCGKNCESRKTPNSFLAKANEDSRIKKIIGVVSGKGGVGKSMITSLLASGMEKRGYQAAILDADITGPSIPKAFGVSGEVYQSESGLLPLRSEGGVKVMSINLLTENETDPVIWRGPILANTVKQFYSDVAWGEVDYMFVDMPPGTGDVPLTVFQSLPLDGIVIVTSPQELVSMIVAKAVHMAEKMNIPILGIVENMSYLICPDCGKKIEVFGKSRIEETASEYGISEYAKLPISTSLASLCDAGKIEHAEVSELDGLLSSIEK